MTVSHLFGSESEKAKKIILHVAAKAVLHLLCLPVGEGHVCITAVTGLFEFLFGLGLLAVFVASPNVSNELLDQRSER